jgi:hypothetical protein
MRMSTTSTKYFAPTQAPLRCQFISISAMASPISE